MLLTLEYLLSSKFIIILIPAFLLFSCGVKSDPKPPEDTILPSITSQYLYERNDGEGAKKAKKVDTEEIKENQK